MANPFRGAVALKTSEKDYQLSFSVNALCEIEDHYGRPIAEVGKAMQVGDKFEIKTLRFILWAGLQDHQPDVSIMDAGLIASDAGIPACGEAIGKAFQLAFPQADEGGKGKSRPLKGAAR